MINAKAEITKARFRQAINENPYEIKLMRDVKTDVGRESTTTESVEIKTFECALDFTKSALSELASQSGDFGKVKKVKSLEMLAIVEDTFQIEIGDYFMLNGARHEILYPMNIFSVYWQCDVVVYLDD